MIDLEKLKLLHQKGMRELGTLQKAELAGLQGFSAYACDEIIKRGLSNKKDIGDIALNSFAWGLMLGLELRTENGRVVER